MAESKQPLAGHPAGDQPSVERAVSRDSVSLDTYAGPVHVEWDPDAAVTPLGHLAFFAEYLKASGRFDALVADSPPLTTRAPTRPGSAMCSARFSCRSWRATGAMRTSRPCAATRSTRALLGMGRVVSEDAVRPWLGQDRGGGRGQVAARPPRRHAAPAAVGALDSRLRHHHQDALRPSRGRRGRLQPAQAGPPVACLPHVFDGRRAPGAGTWW